MLSHAFRDAFASLAYDAIVLTLITELATVPRGQNFSAVVILSTPGKYSLGVALTRRRDSAFCQMNLVQRVRRSVVSCPHRKSKPHYDAGLH